MRILRLIRGVVTTALTWAAAWVPFSLIPFGVATLAGADVPLRLLVGLAIGKAVTGAISGATFAGLLAITGRRRTFDSLSLPWIAGLGALGGAVFPAVLRTALLATTNVAIPPIALITGLVSSSLLGAGCASMTLMIARRAPELPRGEASRAPAIGAGAA